jgi:N-acetylglucosaminyl-diphospho-decaprenol L-rhamnosyltransferase
MTPLISALVLNYRSPLATVRCVRELANQSMATEMEIIVIDNHSDDDSIGTLRNRLKDIPHVRIVETSKNVGFGAGYGAALRHARGKYLLLNNPDKILEEQGARKLAEVLEKDTSIGIVAPKLMHDDGTVRMSARAFPRPLDVLAKRTFLQKLMPGRVRHYLQMDAALDERRDVDWVAGGCLMMRADLARDIAGFDPRFFLFFEDIDLCRRTWLAGKKVVYEPGVVGWDRKRRLSEMSALRMPFSKLGRAHLASAMKYFWKWRGISPSRIRG